MNQNIFRSAIRDVRNSTQNSGIFNKNNFRSAMKLDKKNVGREFTEEIDFDQESLNLGEDDASQEEYLNHSVKVTKLHSSIIANAKNAYPSSFDRKTEFMKNNENVNFLISRNCNNDTSKAHKEILIPKKNKPLVIRNKDNQEIVIHGDYNKKDLKIEKKFFINENLNSDFRRNNNECPKQWKHDKFNETVLLNYSIFVRNLPMNITESKLRDIFSSCGPIISLHLERDTAEIYYPRKENAIDAVDKFNHTEVNGKKIKISFYENLEENKNSEWSANNGSNPKNKTVINLDEFRTKREPFFLKPNKNKHKGEIILMDV